MKELCIPVPDMGENEIAELLLTVGNKQIKYHFRVESFPWEIADNTIDKAQYDTEIEAQNAEALIRINKLKNAIKNYDKNWELIQIFTPPEKAKHIQILYRKKM